MRARYDRAARWVTGERTGGLLLVVAAVLALAWANSPWRDAYHDLVAAEVGPASWHLQLTLGEWAADGLLAIFFFVVGLELKEEIVAGSLRDPRRAAVPVLAAVGGMVAPAVVFVAVVHLAGDPAAAHGWAIPTATDIAFALAVLAIFGRGLPTPVRTFLLTLAVVDDLLGITVIATVYTETVRLPLLLAAVAGVVLFGVLVRLRRPRWWYLLPLGLAVWALVHASGVHATVAGVLLGFVVPVRAVHGELVGRAERYDHLWRPVSAGLALPLFAFFAAGVTLVGGEGVVHVLTEPIALAVMAGLVIGKPVGVMLVTWATVRLTPLRLAPGVGVRDLLPVGMLAGIGFTVALLISELSFTDGTPADLLHTETAKAAVLVGTVIAAVLSAFLLRHDAKGVRPADVNEDGVDDGESPRIGAPDDPGY
ncbi:Na+/H+ antiporter NhaA [Luteimicrobium subarcticum]|uniref:Na+/H+ antiporter NhaA n=1 Tax=Luteimicrobium subarcticum TaxID=620910 RepID=UPI001FE8EFFD|nr:Na+/H+ antiporter NhaA [Luteimicrobium subarcticum]